MNFDQPSKMKESMGKFDFRSVLDRVSLGVPYTIPELEFEFDTSWEKLKPLLDGSVEYSLDGESVVIKSKEKPEIDLGSEDIDEAKDQEWIKFRQELDSIFYKKEKDRNGHVVDRYRSVKADKWPKDKMDILEKALKQGIVLTGYDNRYVLFKWLRKPSSYI